MTSLTAVVPWRDHRELERDFWAAMRAADDVAVLVVDDGSEPPLPNAWRIDRSGFSRACNAGLALARTDAALFLNNDIAATRAGWDVPIRELVEPGVLVGANLRFDSHGNVEGEPMPYLDGWCLAGMRDDLVELGGWDEGYKEPAYYGDNDLCLRARASGMTLREVNVGLMHKGNATAGPPSDPVVRAATLANRERFERRAAELLEMSVA